MDHMYMSATDVERDICHRTDGPLTPHVLMCRAMRLAAEDQAEPDTAADGLWLALQNLGWLSDRTKPNPSINAHPYNG